MIGEIGPGKLLTSLAEWIEPVYGPEESRSIASMIVEKKFNLTRKDLAVGRPFHISDNEISAINAMLKRLLNHEPVQYILGEAFFYDRWYKVNPSVLIPRSETEELCQLVIDENREQSLRILDIGTGSGCIAITLALHMNNPLVTGWDFSEEAMKVALENARSNKVNINFELQDILEDIDEADKFDIIVCNPPYVTPEEAVQMRKNVLEFEPHEAIFVQGDPLKFYSAVLNSVSVLLFQSGKIYFEINESAGDAVCKMMETAGLRKVQILKDIHGKDRFVSGVI